MALSMLNQAAANSNQSNCLLLGTPREIQQKIYGYIAKNDGPIIPEQWLPGSSLFTHDSRWSFGKVMRGPTGNEGHKPEELSIFNLAKACRQLHRETEATGLFYRINRFEFRDMKAMHIYLAALRRHRKFRRQWMTNITMPYDNFINPELPITLLATLPNLTTLNFDISLMAKYFRSATKIENVEVPGIRQLRKLRGLTNFNLIYHKISNNHSEWYFTKMVILHTRKEPRITDKLKASLQLEVDQFEQFLRTSVTDNAHTNNHITQDEIDIAVDAAGIDWEA